MKNNSYSETSNDKLSLNAQGLTDQPWWVDQWLELINSYRFKKRLERAWNYAKAGNVLSIKFKNNYIYALVQGTEKEPYQVKLWLETLNDEDWKYVIESLTQKVRWSAQLLAGTMPIDIEQAFAASGKRLFPFKLDEVLSECSCPDKANPCKHISAIYFLMGDRFREDPFMLFELRGRTKARLLNELAQKRLNIQKQDKANNQNKEKRSNQKITTHPAFDNPSLWWEYQGELNNSLVVITPAMEKESAVVQAGELTLAKDHKFPKSNQIFVEELINYAEVVSQQAMVQAMSNNDLDSKTSG